MTLTYNTTARMYRVQWIGNQPNPGIYESWFPTLSDALAWIGRHFPVQTPEVAYALCGAPEGECYHEACLEAMYPSETL